MSNDQKTVTVYNVSKKTFMRALNLPPDIDLRHIDMNPVTGEVRLLLQRDESHAWRRRRPQTT